MNLEEFLDERLTKEQMEGLNANSKIERMEKYKEDNKLTIALPNELVDMINSNTECKKILRSNIVRFMKSLNKELEIER
ncbi:hypothetical protein [Clostridium paraputrificum]|uniref:hypothetical protein n=1 Tax=Clostridium paraputrificum TaxID=29363 RepID=UPI000DD05564|nr:hypothetical protein [Clostridium paraputrificum]MDB2115672.1 hypothetical protein [Clostridium paraputrificum]